MKPKENEDYTARYALLMTTLILLFFVVTASSCGVIISSINTTYASSNLWDRSALTMCKMGGWNVV